MDVEGRNFHMITLIIVELVECIRRAPDVVKYFT